MSWLCRQSANDFNWSWLSEEQHLPSESFVVSFCLIFVLVVSEWTPCTILPKICLLCVVFFSNVWGSRYLLVQTSSLVNWKKKVEHDFERHWLFQLSLIVSWQLLRLLSAMCVVLHCSNFCVFSEVHSGCFLLF